MEKFELITEQQAFENKVVEVIKNLVHRSLQWEDGEIKGWDEQMITSLVPILLKPFFADLLAKVSEQQREIDALRKLYKEQEAAISYLQSADRGSLNYSYSLNERLERIAKLKKETFL